MKLIRLKISKCEDCPYAHWNLEEYECSKECNILYDSQIIPDWCPLETVDMYEE